MRLACLARKRWRMRASRPSTLSAKCARNECRRSDRRSPARSTRNRCLLREIALGAAQDQLSWVRLEEGSLQGLTGPLGDERRDEMATVMAVEFEQGLKGSQAKSVRSA